MATMEEIVKQADLLGYRGEKREEYLKQKFRLLAERQERKEKEEAERQAREKKEEADRKERLELEKMKLDAEMTLLQAKIEAGIIKNESDGSGARSSDAGAKHPKLPNFQDGRDDLDIWLTRFERFAESNGWSREKWSSSLCALLTRRALDCYGWISAEHAKDYDKVKEALMKRYDLTEDGYRRKFRTCKPAEGESPDMFIEPGGPRHVCNGGCGDDQGASEAVTKPLRVPDIERHVGVDREQVIKLQQEDPRILALVDAGRTSRRAGKIASFEKARSIVCRRYQDLGRNVDVKQMVLPKLLQEYVMSVAHNSITGAHLGIRRTKDKVPSNFYWPGVDVDVTRYCRSCDVCQRTVKKGTVPRVPLEKVPLIDTPFQRVAIDLVGPINPPSGTQVHPDARGLRHKVCRGGAITRDRHGICGRGAGRHLQPTGCPRGGAE
ncbi:gypsy retrotransposon integrase-like protein 1 [Plakobranchus ocellatus]|uniref:Gypsy retrotransposon integrase-like protein 1 n=1 Tax=Plakobranchus ocellatus TaxID=259542 RepID=A0AAV4AVQ8_9GAST|nr:gypsy retrotransposon integrase-like protein 1 [Plakobranchus ocellatus]